MLDLIAFTCSTKIVPGSTSVDNFKVASFGSLVFSCNVPYVNLQWRRDFYESGTFEVQVPLIEYNPEWIAFTVVADDEPTFGNHVRGSYDTKRTYIYHTSGELCTSACHNDVGIILKRTFYREDNNSYVLLSGCMGDCICDAEVHVQDPQTSATRPEYAIAKAISQCDDYVASTCISLSASDVDIAAAPRLAVEDYTPTYHACIIGTHYRQILKTRELGLSSCIVRGAKSNEYAIGLYVRSGVDRTVDQTVRDAVLIGYEVGNVNKEIVTVDSSAMRAGYRGWLYKEGAQISTAYIGAPTSYTSVLDMPVAYGRILGDCESTKGSNQTLSEFVSVAKEKAAEALQDYVEEVTISLDTSTVTANVGVGDDITVHVAALDKTMNAKVTGVEEVCKEGEYRRTITLGSGSLTNSQRLALAVGGRKR